MALKLIHGTDEYLVSLHARRAVNALCPEEDQALGLETVNGDVKTVEEAVSALKTCIGALRTVGLFGGHKTVWFCNVSVFKDKTLSKNESVKELLDVLAAEIKNGLSETQHLIISAPGVDRRSAFFKACGAAGEVEAYDLPEQEYKKRSFIRERTQSFFRKARRKISNQALDLFLEKVGSDTRQLVMEAEKLILYAGENDRITEEDVKAITSSAAEAITWDFTDALGERRLEEALRILRKLLFQGESPVGILFTIGNLYQTLSQYRAYLDAGWVELRSRNAHWSGDPEMDRLFGQMPADPRTTHPFRAGKLLQQAKNYTAGELSMRLKRLLETHEQMVSGGVPQEVLLEVLIIRLTAKTKT